LPNMARVLQNREKYTPEEWHHSNNTNYRNAEHERKTAEMIRDESVRLANETHLTTIKTQNDVNKKLDQRLSDVSFWKQELDRQFKETDEEIESMLSYKNRLETALAATEDPLMVTKTCLMNRTERLGVDLVHDDVEIQLIKEVEVIEGIQLLLKKTLGQAVEQIRLLRSANYYLNKDICDKFGALSIDTTCADLKNSSDNKYFAPTSVTIQPNSVTPEEWETLSNKNVQKAERERNSSTTLRSQIDEILMDTYTDGQKQFDTTNLALKKRIDETQKAKDKLTDHLAKVEQEINDMEVNIDYLKDAIQQKEAPMQVSQTRLDLRSTRPNNELARDRVLYRLLGEVSEITVNVDRLKEMLSQSQESLKALVRKQLTLQEDIQVKSTSLEIDGGRNTQMRTEINYKQH